MGLSRCVKMLALPKSMITTPPNFKFTAVETATPAAFKAAVQAALLAGIAQRIFLWPMFSAVENASEETVYNTTPLGVKRVRKGFYAWRFTITEDLCTHKAMQSHFSNAGRAYVWDVEDNVWGTIDPSNDDFYGLTYSLLSPEKLIISDGSVPTGSPVYLVVPNPNEIDINGGIIDGSSLGMVTRLSDVVLKVLTPAPTATTINVSVTASCDGTPIVGLEDVDFVLKTAAGAPQAITAIVDHGDGSYTLTGVGLVTGTLNLVAPDVLSLTGYESTGPKVITIA